MIKLNDTTRHNLKAIAIKCGMLVVSARQAKRDVYSDELLHYIIDAFELGMEYEKKRIK